MRICIVGAGGVGGYFGARLAAVGSQVLFVARGAHRQAMERQGLRVTSALGDLHLDRVALYDAHRKEEPYDMFFVCTKMWDLEGAAEIIRPLLGTDSGVIPLQNGVSSEELLAEALGDQHVLGGTAHIAARIAAPGHIEHTGTMARLLFGERDGRETARLAALQAAVEAAGIEHTVSRTVERDVWTKFLFLAPLAGATCFYRATVGAVLAQPERKDFLGQLVEETRAVASATGIDLSHLPLDKVLKNFAALPAEMKTSMLHDLEAGRRLELPWLNGDISRRGQALGIATPANDRVTEALQPFIMGNRQSQS